MTRRRMLRTAAILPAVLVAAGGAAFIFYQWAGGRPFWVDEEMIAINIRDRSFGSLAGPLWLGQSAPLGWLAVQRVLVLVSGTSEQALRFVPALFGAFTLGAAVWVGRRWMTALGAFTFVVLCTFGLWISFFPLELKHYSADAFWGLVLPALAVWALEGESQSSIRRRGLVWWVIAAMAHWLSNGGLFAAPGCALLMFGLTWKRHGAREAFFFTMGGLIWLASFALYYKLSLSYTHQSSYLRGYWIAELPPASLGFGGTIAWLAARLPQLASDPAGTAFWVLLWASAFAGFALAASPALGIAFATAPLTAFVLAAFGVVPLYGRFVLWTVPALYAGVALLANRAVLSARARGLNPVLRFGLAILIAAAILPLGADIVGRGFDDFRKARGGGTNHGLDDRAAVRWLLAQRRSGDAIISTRLGWPAIWWYGAIAPTVIAGGDRLPHYEVNHGPAGIDCEDLAETLKPHTRALVHVGFPDSPEGFGELLMRQLDRIGALDKYREFSHIGFVAIVDLHTPEAEQSSLNLIPPRQPEPKPLTGCVTVKPAVLWE